MPSLDITIGRKKHIADRNTHVPVNTLCGLDLNSVSYFEHEPNFYLVDCKTCRLIYFNERPNDL